MKVVCMTRQKPATRAIQTRTIQKNEKVIKIQPIIKEKVKLPELDPVLKETIDYKSPLLLSFDKGREIQTERPNISNSRHVTFRQTTATTQQRPKTTLQFQARNVDGLTLREMRLKKEEEQKKKEPIILDTRTPYQIRSTRPLGKKTNYKSNIHEKIESIYYLRSQSSCTPISEMKTSQNLGTTRQVPHLLMAKEKQAGICFT